MAEFDRDAELRLSEGDLERHVEFHAYRSGGPGGQKRNKTSSAVRLTHTPTGIIAHSSDFRSQRENRVRALHRLRFKIAAEVRAEVELKGYEPPAWVRAMRQQEKFTTNTHNLDYARLAGHLLDLLSLCDGRLAAAAALVGVSSGNLAAVLSAEPTIDAAARSIRKNAIESTPASRRVEYVAGREMKRRRDKEWE
jgi:hypothetical protein